MAGQVFTAAGEVATAAGRNATYTGIVGAGVAASITAATNPTDIIVLAGSATKIVRINLFNVLLAMTAASTGTFANGPSIQFVLRSSLDTGGTSVAVTPFTLDRNNAASGASLVYYTANPSGLGTQVGVVSASFTAIPVLTGIATIFSYGAGMAGNTAPGNVTQGVVLRGVNDCLCANLLGTARSGLQFAFAIGWTESAD